MIEKSLPSGSKLKITIAPFAEARALYQAVLEELRSVSLDPKAEIDTNLLKDLFCVGLSSKKIEAALDVCMKRVLIDDKKIDENTFEPVEKRQDYIPACFETAKANIDPFAKSLYAEFSPVLEILKAKGPA